jgi:ribosome-binding factor A
MKGKRAARLNEQLKREISELIRTQVRDPRVGLVTITGVEVAADLGSARVFVRRGGSEDDLESTLEGLRAAAPFLRKELGGILSIRKIPELRFQKDRSLEHAQRIERILSEVIPPEKELEKELDKKLDNGPEKEPDSDADDPGNDQ